MVGLEGIYNMSHGKGLMDRLSIPTRNQCAQAHIIEVFWMQFDILTRGHHCICLLLTTIGHHCIYHCTAFLEWFEPCTNLTCPMYFVTWCKFHFCSVILIVNESNDNMLSCGLYTCLYCLACFLITNTFLILTLSIYLIYFIHQVYPVWLLTEQH